MLDIKEALKLPPDSAELDDEIKERLKLRDEMVGWLYPQILTDEIDRLVGRRDHIPTRFDLVTGND